MKNINIKVTEKDGKVSIYVSNDHGVVCTASGLTTGVDVEDYVRSQLRWYMLFVPSDVRIGSLFS